MQPIQITLTLFNRPFKLKVMPQSEEALRSAVKSMNENIETYKKQFPGQDDFSYLAMAVMTLVSCMSENPSGAIDAAVIEKLRKVEEML
jgi:cell division protein ZapA (FtsZ GTPase activity inhibitor)